jgi:predicted AAA+ superfamily ATPase
MTTLCVNLSVKRPTVISFLNLLEASHLIYRLPPFGYGKEILRARYKVYLADAAIAGSVLLKGNSLLEDTTRLGAAVETAMFHHLRARQVHTNVTFAYWRGGNNAQEVDLIELRPESLTPYEVKYTQGKVQAHDLKGMALFCAQRACPQGYVFTRDMGDFGLLPLPTTASTNTGPMLLRIPAPLACLWLSQPLLA